MTAVHGWKPSPWAAVYAEDVPWVHSLAFEKAYIDYSTLHVPASAVDAYRAVAPWSEFGTIVAIDDPTGIKGVNESGMSVADAPYYSIGGVCEQHPGKGLYIKNRRKVILK